MIESPCISECLIMQTSQGTFCIGCGRTLDDINGWMSATDQEKKIININAMERLFNYRDLTEEQ